MEHRGCDGIELSKDAHRMTDDVQEHQDGPYSDE
jgi:hypothetical protein